MELYRGIIVLAHDLEKHCSLSGSEENQTFGKREGRTVRASAWRQVRVEGAAGQIHLVGVMFKNEAAATHASERVRSSSAFNLAPRSLAYGDRRFMYGEVRPPLVSSSRPKDVPCLEERGEGRLGRAWSGEQRKSGSDCPLVRNSTRTAETLARLFRPLPCNL